jgi:hypothetical protein
MPCENQIESKPAILIADAEESASFRRYVVPDARLRENKELAEIIAVCIRETALPQLINPPQIIKTAIRFSGFSIPRNRPNCQTRGQNALHKGKSKRSLAGC